MLSPRQGLPRIPLRGIFQGAKVVRGPDWEWGSQDGEWGPGGKVGSQDVGGWGGKVGGAVVGGGCHQLWLILMAWVYPAGGATVFPGGEGKPGRVVDIRGWDVETGRSVASVTWADGTTNVYRVGHKGKVDLKCVGEAAGGFYYREHLPRLGMGGPSTTCPPPFALRPALDLGVVSGVTEVSGVGRRNCLSQPCCTPHPQASLQSCSAGSVLMASPSSVGTRSSVCWTRTC